MAKKFPLQTVLELIERQTDEIAKQLSLLKAQWQSSEQKLDQLKNIKIDYHSRRTDVSSNERFSIDAWKNYYSFLGRLDHAIEVQKQEVERKHQTWQLGLKKLQESQKKLKAIEILKERHVHQEMLKEAKIEQKQNDEYAVRIYLSQLGMTN